MQRCKTRQWLAADPELRDLIVAKAFDTVFSPNDAPIRDAGGKTSTIASRSTSHGDFDDDEATVRSTLARILATNAAVAQPAGAVAKAEDKITFFSSSASMRARREMLDRQSMPAG